MGTMKSYTFIMSSASTGIDNITWPNPHAALFHKIAALIGFKEIKHFNLFMLLFSGKIEHVGVNKLHFLGKQQHVDINNTIVSIR